MELIENDWLFLAREEQLPPDKWGTVGCFMWDIRSGRGWGKTRTAAEFINTFRNLYPDVNSYLRKASRAGLAKLEARTLTGRLFKFYPPCGQTEEERKAEEGSIMRESKNLPVQGLCADMLKIAMASLFTVLEPRGVKLVNCIHDELVFECKAAEAEEVGEIIKVEMEKAGSLFLKDLPCVVDVTIADFWKKE